SSWSGRRWAAHQVPRADEAVRHAHAVDEGAFGAAEIAQAHALALGGERRVPARDGTVGQAQIRALPRADADRRADRRARPALGAGDHHQIERGHLPRRRARPKLRLRVVVDHAPRVARTARTGNRAILGSCAWLTSSRSPERWPSRASRAATSSSPTTR